MKPFSAQYPFTSNYFDLGDVKMHYLDEGPQEAPVVVMVHGNPTWSFYWRNLIPTISKTHRVIVPDHMGCGLSDKPQDYTYTLEQHIQNLEKLLKHLDVHNVTLIMHDWGGGIGTGYATRHPENIKAMVVTNTSAFFRPVLYWGIKLARLPILGDILVRGFNAFLLGTFVMGTSQSKHFTKAVRAGYLHPYRNWNDRIAILRFVQDIPMNASHPTRSTINEMENKLHLLNKKPMLIFWGVDDPVFTTGTFLAGWIEHFPEAEVHKLENAGHFIIEDAHERILPRLTSFLMKQLD